MPRKDTRPVYLNLLRIRLPVTGAVSILHRASGVLLVLCIPLLLYGLQQSLTEPYFFQQVAGLLSAPLGRVAAYVLLGMFTLHFCSGIRHLLLDLDIGIERDRARVGAWLVYAVTFMTLILVAVTA